MVSNPATTGSGCAVFAMDKSDTPTISVWKRDSSLPGLKSNVSLSTLTRFSKMSPSLAFGSTNPETVICSVLVTKRGSLDMFPNVHVRVRLFSAHDNPRVDRVRDRAGQEFQRQHIGQHHVGCLGGSQVGDKDAVRDGFARLDRGLGNLDHAQVRTGENLRRGLRLIVQRVGVQRSTAGHHHRYW